MELEKPQRGNQAARGRRTPKHKTPSGFCPYMAPCLPVPRSTPSFNRGSLPMLFWAFLGIWRWICP